jgi:hypothetical protein
MEMNENNVNGVPVSEVRSVDDVKRHFGALKSNLMGTLFELASNIRSEEAQLDERVRSRAGDNVVRQLDLAARELKARDAIEKAKIEFISLELEEAEALDALATHANEVLSPKQASVESVLMASTMTEEQIVDASDAAAAMGDAGEDTLLVLLRASIERGFDGAMHHIAAFNEDWADAVNILAETTDSPDLNEEDFAARFDSMAPRSSAVELLGGGESELNKLGRIR